ncbi:zinc finger protein 90 homolog [Aethina tumida]|uniref:zinc finger protein 90 homolog n=1 Tax=Aethina tumida TaxID=116153 RepID=UPI00214754D7|nr:zinc finger protein 90 homolog [Aethina tumida]
MKENKTVTIENFPIICRICLNKRTGVQILNVKRRKVLLSDLLTMYTSIKVKEDDKKPDKICKMCENKMFTVHNFVQNCKRAESILNSLLLKHKIDDNFDPSDNLPLITFVQKKEPDDKLVQDEYEIKDEYHSDNNNGFDDNDEVDSEMDIESNVPATKILQPELEIEDKETHKNNTDKIKRKRQYSCKVCNQVFKDYESVKEHRKEYKHVRQKRHSCPTCNKTFQCNYRLKEHIRTHTGERPNVCDTCNKRFNSKSDLKRHIVIIHLNIKKYKCQYCDKGFSRKFYLRDHERTHTGERLYSSCCAKEFTSYYSLYHHEKKHKYNKMYVKKIDPNKPIKKESGEEGNYRCYICPKVLRTDYSLKRHISVKHDIRNLTCDDCGAQYPSIRELNEHIRSTHKDHPYTIAHNVKEFSCMVCAKEFKYKSSLRDHMRVHTGDTKFKCSECDKICLNRRKLNEHMRIHTGEKPYTCSYCGKNFRTLTNMSEHQKTHTTERNHVCAKCGKSFYDARSLKKHSATHENNIVQ